MRTGLVLFLLAAAASSRSLPHYDLDSLAWQSRFVVEVEYLGERRARVVRSFLGDLAPGATVPCPEYDLLAAHWKPVPLEPKPHLFLFLDAKKQCASSGAWLVRDGRVLKPFQFQNPGGYAWILEENAPAADSFRNALRARIEAAKELERRLAREPVADDAPALLALLRSRAALPGGRRVTRAEAVLDFEAWKQSDLVARAAAEDLASLHDFDALADALVLPLGWRALDTLAHGFATPAGRTDLLRRIGDESLEPARRVAWAAFVEDAAPRHWKNSTLSEDDARYFTRVATLARGVAAHEELCATLCEEIQHGAGPAATLQADLRGAVRPLALLHRESRSERIRFEAAHALARIGADAYAACHSPAGPALGRLFEPNVQGRWIRFRYEYRSRTPYDRSVVVLARDGREAEIDVDLDRGAWDSYSGPLSVTAPPSLPPGVYRASIRLYRASECVSRSYGCEVEVPGRGSR